MCKSKLFTFLEFVLTENQSHAGRRYTCAVRACNTGQALSVATYYGGPQVQKRIQIPNNAYKLQYTHINSRPRIQIPIHAYKYEYTHTNFKTCTQIPIHAYSTKAYICLQIQIHAYSTKHINRIIAKWRFT